MLKRITDEEIVDVGLFTPVDNGTYWMKVGRKIAELQLKADRQSVEDKREGIEENLRIFALAVLHDNGDMVSVVADQIIKALINEEE